MTKGYDIKNSTDKIIIRFYGDILMQDEWWKEDSDKSPQDIVDALNEANGKEIEIRINSGGGSVFGGMAIYNVLKSYSGKKTVFVDGIAASIASVIMLAGDTINIPKNATIMIHDPWSVCVGTAEDMEKAKASLETIKETILSVYESHAKVSKEELAEMMEKETWMSGDAAAKVFNIDLSDEVKVAACVASRMMNFYNNTPPDIHKMKDEQSENKAMLSEIKEYIKKERESK